MILLCLAQYVDTTIFYLLLMNKQLFKVAYEIIYSINTYTFFTRLIMRAFFFGAYPAYAKSRSVNSTSVMVPSSLGPFR